MKVFSRRLEKHRQRDFPGWRFTTMLAPAPEIEDGSSHNGSCGLSHAFAHLYQRLDLRPLRARP